MVVAIAGKFLAAQCERDVGLGGGHCDYKYLERAAGAC
jgi:hypothetical protein